MFRKNIKKTLFITPLLIVTACETVTDPVVVTEPTKRIEPVKVLTNQVPPQLIINPSKEDIIYVQAALKSLGYSVGFIDGIWGKRTESSLLSFEKANQLASLNGKLSDVNFAALKSKHSPSVDKLIQEQSQPQEKSIFSQLKSKTPNRKSPELIITEKTYNLMVKDNPYSEVLSQLKSGTGLYVLSLQNGFYEVETLSKEYGFIKKD